eukprot:TRINITY_DN23772_c0_g1_i1.p1 TRINITY_DN23772_c0_g1~~TRINITY_DN23772_c0_g1_i1.p1  ORF type:complete len:580 (-),score=119.86 TRINITY_DN23772_c0_g1_i1:169-1908(-)
MQAKGNVQLAATGSAYVPGKIVRVAPGRSCRQSISPGETESGGQTSPLGGTSTELFSRSNSGQESLRPSPSTLRATPLPAPQLMRGASAPASPMDLSGMISRKTLSSTLTPSMALIADQGRVVEFRGGGGQNAFDVGGRHGNVVTASRVNNVHRGWRVSAVDGQRLQPSEVKAVLASVRKKVRYTVTFSLGERLFVEDTRDVDPLTEVVDDSASCRQDEERKAAEEEERRRMQAEAAARSAAEVRASEEARRQAEADLEAERAREIAAARDAEQRAAAAAAKENEALRKRQIAAERERAAELERQAAEAAAKSAAAAAAKEEERRKSEEEAQKKKAAELVVERKAVESRLEELVGLPSRDSLVDPQSSLLKALTRTPEPPSVAQEKRGGPCDKCDGPHHEDDCPFFKKSRAVHKDAMDRYNPKGVKKASNGAGNDGNSGEHILRSARIVQQPGDGSCLFHSLSYGLKSTNATKLRADVADFVAENPEAIVAGNPLKDWVLWDSGLDVRAYARTMRTGSRWGGALEIAVCAQITGKPVHVYERSTRGYVRISAFGDDTAPSGEAVNVHYGGRVHYDALEV